ncbi:MAG: metallopeptidase TldD-related protein [Myxococcaceae bacterium]
MPSTHGLTLTGEPEKRALAEAVLAHVRPKVKYADLLIEEVTKLEYTRLFSGDEVLKPFTRKGALQLRLVGEEGRHLSLSLGLLPPAQLLPSLDFALGMLRLQEPDPHFGLAPVPNQDRQRYGVPSPWDLTSEEVQAAFETVRSEADALAGRAIAGHPGLSAQVELWCYAQVEEKLVQDTEGLFKTQVLPSTFLQVLALVKDAATGRQTRQRTRLGELRPLASLFEEADLSRGLRGDFAETLGGCMRRAVAQQRGRRLTSEELARVTHYVLASTAMVFIHEAEGHNFEADIIREGSSGLFGRDGSPAVTPFASPLVDVWDGQTRRPDGSFDADTGFGTHYIDDEGVELSPVRLVEGGRIVAKLHNRETAHHFKEPANGHGFSELGERRLVRMTNTYLHPSGPDRWFPTVEELVQDIPFGVWLEGSLGGAVSREGMSTTIQYGRLIVDGKLTQEVLLPANLSVVTRDSLQGVEGFAGPVRCDDPGFCGKGQTKTVTDGGPVTKIRASPAITLGF